MDQTFVLGRLYYLANIRRSSGFCAAGILRITCLSCSDRLASSVSVIRLLSGESPPGSSSALELSILGLVRVMSSLLAMQRKHTNVHVVSITLLNLSVVGRTES